MERAFSWGIGHGAVKMKPDEFEELMRIQRSMATRLRTESDMNRKVDLLSLIQGMNPDKRGRILTEQIIVEAAGIGLTADDVQALIDDLETDGYLERVEQGIMMLL